MADGNLNSTYNIIELSLKESDKEHLEKYLKFLEHKAINKIKYHTNKLGNSYRLTITNKHIWNTLNNLGCTPRKSLTLKFPNIKEHIIDFIRGYFDGDGCLTYKRYKDKVKCSCTIISTLEFL